MVFTTYHLPLVRRSRCFVFLVFRSFDRSSSADFHIHKKISRVAIFSLSARTSLTDFESSRRTFSPIPLPFRGGYAMFLRLPNQFQRVFFFCRDRLTTWTWPVNSFGLSVGGDPFLSFPFLVQDGWCVNLLCGLSLYGVFFISGFGGPQPLMVREGWFPCASVSLASFWSWHFFSQGPELTSDLLIFIDQLLLP